jgi:hypothetical protein
MKPKIIGEWKLTQDCDRIEWQLLWGHRTGGVHHPKGGGAIALGRTVPLPYFPEATTLEIWL